LWLRPVLRCDVSTGSGERRIGQRSGQPAWVAEKDVQATTTEETAVVEAPPRTFLR